MINVNLGSIWSGNDYAVLEGRGRNEMFPMQARRVRAIRTFKRQEFGNERGTGYVECHFLTDEGEYRENPPRLREVRARDFWSFWDEYEEERDRRRRRQMEIERERQERLARENADREAFLDKVESKGLPRTCITYITDNSLSINRGDFEAWLEKISN